MGEIIEISSSSTGISIFSSLVGLLAILVYALLTDFESNDDDDSDSGSGGLMQPIT